MIDIEKLQKIGEFVSKNWLATIVGILIGGTLIAALYEKFLLPNYHAQLGPSSSRPDAQYETWQIKGAVNLQSGNVSYKEVTTSIQPPDLRLMPDGSFTAEVLVKVKSNGQREYPKLLFSGIESYTTPVIHISEPGTAHPPGTKDYDAQHLSDKREIWLKKKVEFKPKSKEQLRPTEIPLKFEAVGGQSKEVEK